MLLTAATAACQSPEHDNKLLTYREAGRIVRPASRSGVADSLVLTKWDTREVTQLLCGIIDMALTAMAGYQDGPDPNEAFW